MPPSPKTIVGKRPQTALLKSVNRKIVTDVYSIFSTCKRPPTNFIWPEHVSYENPVVGVKIYGCNSEFLFRLQSGEMTDNDFKKEAHGDTDSDEEVDGFEDLDWSLISTIAIRYNPERNAKVRGLEFYYSQSKKILKVDNGGFSGLGNFKVNLREGDRVVGIQAHKAGNEFSNLQFVIMGPQ